MYVACGLLVCCAATVVPVGGLRAARADGSAGSARHLHEPIPRFQGERPEQASLRPERVSLRPKRASLRPERASLRPK